MIVQAGKETADITHGRQVLFLALPAHHHLIHQHRITEALLLQISVDILHAQPVNEDIGSGIIAVGYHHRHELLNSALFSGIVPGGNAGTTHRIIFLNGNLFIQGQLPIMDILHGLGHHKQLNHAGWSHLL